MSFRALFMSTRANWLRFAAKRADWLYEMTSELYVCNTNSRYCAAYCSIPDNSEIPDESDGVSWS